MTWLLTNDDGIDAPGLRALRQAVVQFWAAESITKPVITVAPLHHHSGCSHQVTTHRPIQIEQRSEFEYAIDGTPADCIRIALSHLQLQPELVLSGINAGGNLGADIYVSGTVAAVREAALYRLPGIAISHYIYQRRAIDWDRASKLTVGVLNALLSQFQSPDPNGGLWNVNLPHLEGDAPDPALVLASLCTQPLPAVYKSIETGALQYAGEYGKRQRDLGSDVEVCFSGNIAASRVQLWG
ncbi:MAG: 5'/3'-nucleotidase SurE [Elainella sp.]